MQELIKELQNFWPQVTSIVLLTLLGLFFKRVKATSRLVVQKVQTAIEKHKQSKSKCVCPFELTILKTLNKIESELKPNGGSSLRDAVNKIDKTLLKVSDRLNTMQVSNDLVSDVTNICRWSANKEGKINFVNRPSKKLVGAVDDDALLGDAWIGNVVHIDDRTSTTIEWQRAVAAKSEYHHTFRVVHLTTGEVIRVTSHAKVIFSANGELIGWAGVVIPKDQKH